MNEPFKIIWINALSGDNKGNVWLVNWLENVKIVLIYAYVVIAVKIVRFVKVKRINVKYLYNLAAVWSDLLLVIK